MKRSLFIALIYVCLFTIGCSEDKGNYTYSTFNTITISGIADSYTVERFSDLKISPTIVGSENFIPENFDYLWYIYLVKTEEYIIDTLSKDMKLDASIDVTLGDYVLMFFVREKSSGLSESFTSSLKVINSNSLGLAVLNRVNNEASVAFISTLGTVTEDIYFKSNGESIGTHPVSIHFSPESKYGGTSPGIFILANDERGGVLVDPLSFAHVMDFNEMFWFAPELVLPQAMTNKRSEYLSNEFLINNGKAHSRAVSHIPYQKFGIKKSGDYECAPFIFESERCCFIYDQKYCRFLYIDSGYEINQIAPNSYLFNPSAMDGALVWGNGFPVPDPDNASYDICRIRAVMERNDGSRYLISVDGTVLYSWTGTAREYDYLMTPTAMIEFDVTGTTSFAMSGKDVNFLYYAEGNKITCKSFLTGNVLATYTVDLGNIDHIEFGYDDRQDILYVGVSDGSATSHSGSVLLLQMSSDGSLKEIARYENICGKVVDFTYVEM